MDPSPSLFSRECSKLLTLRWKRRPWILELLGRLGRARSFLANRVADLSGGEIQIVALLRAVQLDPSVLLLDEPTAALDGQTTTAVEQLLKDWVAESPDNRAMVWVTHDTDQAGRVAERTLCIQRGRLRHSAVRAQL